MSAFLINKIHCTFPRGPLSIFGGLVGFSWTFNKNGGGWCSRQKSLGARSLLLPRSCQQVWLWPPRRTTLWSKFKFIAHLPCAEKSNTPQKMKPCLHSWHHLSPSLSSLLTIANNSPTYKPPINPRNPRRHKCNRHCRADLPSCVFRTKDILFDMTFYIALLVGDALSDGENDIWLMVGTKIKQW
jgi:hypothetical protein